MRVPGLNLDFRFWTSDLRLPELGRGGFPFAKCLLYAQNKSHPFYQQPPAVAGAQCNFRMRGSGFRLPVWDFRIYRKPPDLIGGQNPTPEIPFEQAPAVVGARSTA